ncbi:hypothetical protein [Williamsia deligens]|uniref:Uncharacterized protein n=1 Tax=Williamsia deligens TaxID=321325 RepID=A0ABW3G958_9NOCA|nr:hypothetical protein [Williamsia deligens]
MHDETPWRLFTADIIAELPISQDDNTPIADIARTLVARDHPGPDTANRTDS